MRSIVGRFLEHSRIFHFANGGDDEIYLGSADWMPRNLFERCEVVFPVRDAAAKARIHDEILPAYLADTVKARLQQPDGTYIRASKAARRTPRPFSSQDFLMQLAEGKTRSGRHPQTQPQIRPQTQPQTQPLTQIPTQRGNPAKPPPASRRPNAPKPSQRPTKGGPERASPHWPKK